MTMMGLDDLRLHWMTTSTAFQAGGAVLNWVLRETKNEDIDFFFTGPDVAERFELMAKQYFAYCRETYCAKTYQNDATILQLVGNQCSPAHFFGSPADAIGRFDLELCKWAVDSENVYTTNYAVRDLIAKSLHYNGENSIQYLNQTSTQRLFKYSRKGYYASDRDTKKLEGEIWGNS
jgi:hypothetical protein